MTQRGRSRPADETSRREQAVRRLRARLKRHDKALGGLAQAVLNLRAGRAALKAQNRGLAAESLRREQRSVVPRSNSQQRSSAASG